MFVEDVMYASKDRPGLVYVIVHVDVYGFGEEVYEVKNAHTSTPIIEHREELNCPLRDTCGSDRVRNALTAILITIEIHTLVYEYVCDEIATIENDLCEIGSGGFTIDQRGDRMCYYAVDTNTRRLCIITHRLGFQFALSQHVKGTRRKLPDVQINYRYPTFCENNILQEYIAFANQMPPK